MTNERPTEDPQEPIGVDEVEPSAPPEEMDPVEPAPAPQTSPFPDPDGEMVPFSDPDGEPIGKSLDSPQESREK